MPEKVNPEVKARAVRIVQDDQHAVTAPAAAVAKQL